jgi:hypothetical protein
VEPPYSSSQISETAIHREILRIYQTSRRETRPVYDLGRDTAGIEEENWVIRWMLWHVFRYRDNRNKNRRTASPGDEPDSAGGGSPDDPSGPSASAHCTCTPRLDANRFLTSFSSNDNKRDPDQILGSGPEWMTRYGQVVRTCGEVLGCIRFHTQSAGQRGNAPTD